MKMQNILRNFEEPTNEVFGGSSVTVFIAHCVVNTKKLKLWSVFIFITIITVKLQLICINSTNHCVKFGIFQLNQIFAPCGRIQSLQNKTSLKITTCYKL